MITFVQYFYVMWSNGDPIDPSWISTLALINSHQSIITLTSMLSPCVWGLRSWRSKTVDLCYLANRVCSAARARGRVSEQERARWRSRWKEMRSPISTNTFKLSMLEPLACIIKSDNWTFTKLHLKPKLTANAGKWWEVSLPSFADHKCGVSSGMPHNLKFYCYFECGLCFESQTELWLANGRAKKKRKYIL